MADLVTAPIPGADQYAGADVLATNAYNKALTQINSNRLNTLTSYGYTGTVDPTTGVVGGVRIDPNSIYGDAQQLFHNQAIEDRNAQFAAEDRGLFGGLAHQAASELRYQHGAQRTKLGGDLQSALGNLDLQQQQAAESRNNALWQAEQAANTAEMNRQANLSIQDLINSITAAKFDNPKNYSPQELAKIGAAGAGPSPFSFDDTATLAHQFGQMTPEQLASLGVTDSMGNLVRGPKQAALKKLLGGGPSTRMA